MAFLLNDFRNNLMKLFYSRWHNKKIDDVNGYTVLIPTPADLPVFINLALEVVRKQNLTGLKEILIIPDWNSTRFKHHFNVIREQFSDLPLRVVYLSVKDKLAWLLTKSITTRHFTQLIRGIEETTTKYAILHDSDLFLKDFNFFHNQFRTCQSRQLAVYGVESRKSMSRNDRELFVATWELTFDVEWARSFTPSMHKGQIAIVKGKRQEFDTTLLPQYLTDADKIDLLKRKIEYFHFRYVIATYRKFTTNKKLVVNFGLKLFLIRALIDTFDSSNWRYAKVPELEQFVESDRWFEGLKKDSEYARHIQEFTDEYMGIVESGIFEEKYSRKLKAIFKDVQKKLV